MPYVDQDRVLSVKRAIPEAAAAGDTAKVKKLTAELDSLNEPDPEQELVPIVGQPEIATAKAAIAWARANGDAAGEKKAQTAFDKLVAPPEEPVKSKVKAPAVETAARKPAAETRKK